MSNDFYTPSGLPTYGSSLASGPIRNSNDSIEDGFDKLAPLTSKANELVYVKADESGQSTFPVIHTATHNIVCGASPADDGETSQIFFVAGNKYKVLEVRVILSQSLAIDDGQGFGVYLDGVSDAIGAGTALWSESDPYTNLSTNTVYSANPTNTFIESGEKLSWSNSHGSDAYGICICVDLAPSE